MGSGKSKLKNAKQKQAVTLSYEEKVDTFFDEIDGLKGVKTPAISIKEENGELNIATPYNADYVKDIKNLGGKYNPSDKSWTVKSSEKGKVNELVKKRFGQEPRENLVDKEFKTKQGLGVRIGEYNRKDDSFTVNYHNIGDKRRGYASGVKHSSIAEYLDKNNLSLSERGTVIKKVKKTAK